MGQGAYIFGCSGPILESDEAAFFAEAQPWGFILFARNLRDPDQIRRLTSDLREAVGWTAPVLIDQEGGRVERMGAPHWSTWLPPLDQVAANPENAERSMYLRYRVIAAELLNCGIDVNCAPCCDVARPETHAVLRNRCYGTDSETVSRVARAVAQAHFDAGALPVMKHMPGLGLASLDSHLELPRTVLSEQELQMVDFAPFRALADLPMGMSAHLVFAALGETGPATTSPAMIERIRTEIEFDGLLMTDDLSMEALSGDFGERAKAALEAGIDMILHCNGKLPEMEDVVAAAGQMSLAAQNRANRALDARKSADPVDIPALKAELDVLLKAGADG